MLVVGIFFLLWTGQLETGEIIILLRVVLLQQLCETLFTFDYVRSQNSSEKLPSRKVFCEMKDGILIGIDKNEGGTYDSTSNQGTGEYFQGYLAIFVDITPLILKKSL